MWIPGSAVIKGIIFIILPRVMAIVRQLLMV
jgi:hypothetical protein